MTLSKSRSRSLSRSRSRSRKQRVRIAQIVEERLAEVTRDLKRTFLRMKTLKETGIRTLADEKTAKQLMEDELKYKCDYTIFNSTKKFLNKFDNYQDQNNFYQSMNNITNNQQLNNNLISYKRATNPVQKESILKRIYNKGKQIIQNHPKKILGAAAMAALAFTLHQYGVPSASIINNLADVKLPAREDAAGVVKDTPPVRSIVQTAVSTNSNGNFFVSLMNGGSMIYNAANDVYKKIFG